VAINERTTVPTPVGVRQHPASPLRIGVALGAVYLIWGSTYLGIRVVVLGGLPALPFMGARFLLSGTVLCLVLRARRGPGALAVTRRQLAGTALISVLLLFIGNGFVAVAEQNLPSGLAALLVSMTPLWLVVFSTALGSRSRPATWLGIAVGFTGTAVLARPGAHEGAIAWWAVALVLSASLGWSIGTISSGRIAMPADPFVSAAYQMLFGGGAMALVGTSAGLLGFGLGGPAIRNVDLAAVPASAWFGLAYLVTFGSLVAYTSYYWLLRNAPLQLVSTYAYVNPVVAVILGWLILHETVSVAERVGGAIAVLGVAIVITSERRGRRPVVQPSEPPAQRAVT